MRQLSISSYLKSWFVRPTSPLSIETKNYFPALTGIRAVAAYSVFLLHFNPFRTFDDVQSAASNVVNELHVGVCIFFVLSGFLICLRYFDSFSFDKKWFIRYLQNRVARIYPMYFLLTTLTFIVAAVAADGQFDGSLYAAHITFVRGFFDDLRFTGIGPGWSLTVEECFYFSAPVIFLLAKRFRLAWQPLFLILTACALVFISQKTGASQTAGFFGSYKNTLIYTFFGRCFEFYVGIQLALIFKKRRRAASEFPSAYFTALGASWIAACVVALSLLKTPDVAQGLLTPLGIVVNNLVLPFGVAFLFWGLLTEKTALRRALETPLAEVLGKSSYIFYLIHVGVISAFLTENITAHHILPTFIALNIVAIALFYWIEEPLNRRIRKQNWVKKTTINRPQDPSVLSAKKTEISV